MKLRDFETIINRLPAFNLNDIRKIDPNFNRQQLRYWVEKGYIHPLVGGYYRLENQSIGEGYLFMLANRAYQPSYISLESALAYHQIIPETAMTITSVSSRKTRELEGPNQRYLYRTIKPVLMFGYRVVLAGSEIKYLIAEPEKAVLDYLYLHTDIVSPEDIEGRRWNRDRLAQMNSNRLADYLPIFDNSALRRRFRMLEEYLHA